ncbi:hypothetical protein LRP31_34975 (plasmid) [Mesorhizobium mediterraneum]|uniref:Molecular chaperone DnaJ n=1 Tax=Mesorhizobium mediterraneum TaxID=43617 RepID=A0AB36RHA4_9HYPH|nr:hypothetical protein [Mesorhizobium mediterraneum]PAQ03761.1 hypothetical protein CIT25_02890 [Mesorhizobium mediterraneum]WIW57334.1 hypothetical protein LRP31_34975 [Mesorhizobium mediterraneum]
MSDDPSSQPVPASRAIGIYEHYCEHPGCTKWGGWGFPRGKQTIWFCREHRETGRTEAGSN